MSVGRDQIETLQAQRAKLLEEGRAYLVHLVGRVLTPDEEQNHKAICTKVADLTKTIQTWQAQDALERECGAVGDRVLPDDGGYATSFRSQVEQLSPEDLARVRALLGPKLQIVGGDEPLWDRDDPLASREYNEAFRSFLMRRAGGRFGQRERAILARGIPGVDPQATLTSDSDVDGGALIPPRQFVAEMIKEVDDVVFFRQPGWARVFIVRQARALGAPKRTGKVSTFRWSAEIQAPVADASAAFGGRQLEPHYLSGEVDASRDFLRSSVMPADAYIRGEIVRDSGEVEEDGYLQGSGAALEPLGVYTPTALGIPTTRDVTAANTDKVVANDYLKMKYAFKAQYHPSLKFLVPRAAQEDLAEERTNEGGAGQGPYLWKPSTIAGEPDRIHGVPIYMTERGPQDMSTGKYVSIGGDFKWYWIAEALDMEIQVAKELGARNNQDVYLVRRKLDGMPVLDEAFRRLKLA